MQLKNSVAILSFAKIVVLFSLAQKTYSQHSCDSGWVCIEAENCPSAALQIYINKSHNLERCGWNKLSELVCCLDDLTEPGSRTDDGFNLISSSTETPGTTTKKNEPRGTVRKSEEACARYSTLVPNNVIYHISNGENADPGEFPHMAALGFPNLDGGDELQWICGASLVSERHLLTAAHCLTARTRPVRALLGVLNKTEQSPSRREYPLENVTIHPEYNRRKLINDIAIITIQGSVSFGDLVYPACLYTRSDDPIGLIITGWGKLFLGQDVVPETLQKARVVPVPLLTCNETYTTRLQVNLIESQICAGAPNPLVPQDSCPGDSGGPMQILSGEDNTYKLVGVVSFGITDCGGTDPSIYSRVYAYIDWIESVVWPS